MSGPPISLSYTPLEVIKIARPVDRIGYIRGICQNKVVLDLGAMDETAFSRKRGRGTWLHEEIAGVARRVVGLDTSVIVPCSGLVTAPNALILRGNVLQVEDFIGRNDLDPDVVVAGELLEHLENPLEFLKSIRRVSRLKGKVLLLSTPNATAIHNCLIALINRESTHPDHLCILSFKTINTLLVRAGYENFRIIPYHSDFVEMKERNSGLRRNLLICGELVIKLIETTFPLMSFGMIAEVSV